MHGLVKRNLQRIRWYHPVEGYRACQPVEQVAGGRALFYPIIARFSLLYCFFRFFQIGFFHDLLRMGLGHCGDERRHKHDFLHFSL